jgi:hypothetical protein
MRYVKIPLDIFINDSYVNVIVWSINELYSNQPDENQKKKSINEKFNDLILILFKNGISIHING